MMPTTDRDAQALTYLAKRLREETPGAGRWDEAGIWAQVSKLVGRNLASAVEQVTRHAADPEAKTPAAIHRPFVPEHTPQRFHPPKRAEACLTCGYHLSACICGEHRTRPVEANEATTSAGIAACREALGREGA